VYNTYSRAVKHEFVGPLDSFTDAEAASTKSIPVPRRFMSLKTFISVKEASFNLGISTVTCYRWTKAGVLPSIKLGNRRLIPASILEDLQRPNGKGEKANE